MESLFHGAYELSCVARQSIHRAFNLRFQGRIIAFDLPQPACNHITLVVGIIPSERVNGRDSDVQIFLFVGRRLENRLNHLAPWHVAEAQNSVLSTCRLTAKVVDFVHDFLVTQRFLAQSRAQLIHDGVAIKRVTAQLLVEFMQHGWAVESLNVI